MWQLTTPRHYGWHYRGLTITLLPNSSWFRHRRVSIRSELPWRHHVKLLTADVTLSLSPTLSAVVAYSCDWYDSIQFHFMSMTTNSCHCGHNDVEKLIHISPYMLIWRTAVDTGIISTSLEQLWSADVSFGCFLDTASRLEEHGSSHGDHYLLDG